MPKIFTRIVSILLIPTFLLSGITFATPQEKAPEVTVKEIVTDPNNVVIPREFGLVKSKYSADTGKLVIHIQDAHCNYEAQSNIAKILEALIKNDGLKFVAVEGADGAIDTSWFKAFPDDAVRKEVADYFMKKGEITGPEFLSITTDYPIKLFGAETREYYLQNLNAFTSSYPLKAETEKYFNTIKAALNKLKGFIYSDELKLIDLKDAEYEAKKLQFNEYVRFLQSEAEKNKINLREYENFFKLVSVLIYEKKIDFNVTDKERSDLIDEITKKLSKEGVTQLVSQSISFKIGKISSADYYNYLKSLSSANSIDLAKSYPNLYNYIIYNSVYSKIENEKLFNDITAVEGAIKEKLFKNDDQRTLEKLSRHVDTLIGLVNIKLLNGDFDYYKNHKEEFSVEAFSDFIRKKTAQFGLSMAIEPPSDAVTKSVTKLEDFYAIAIRRDKALVDNTLNEMKRSDQRIAVLVTGGFHSEGIAKLLEKEGISYMVICPSITKDVPTPYIQVLTNQRTSFEDIVMGAAEPAQPGMLAPPVVAWLLGLNDEELEEICKATDPARVPPVESLREMVERVKIAIDERYLPSWLGRAFHHAGDEIFRVSEQEDAMRGVFVSVFSDRLAALVKYGFLSQESSETLRERITTKEFSEEFHNAFVIALSKLERAQADDDGKIDRAKRTGEAAFNNEINTAIRASNTRIILDPVKGTDGVETKYASLIEDLSSRIRALPDSVFLSILQQVGEAPDSPISKAFTKDNMLAKLAKGGGLTIKLVEGKEEVPGLKVPGIRMNEQGSTYGHYSPTTNKALYMAWGATDRFMETPAQMPLAAALLGHELAEFVALTIAYPKGIDAAQAKDIAAKVHMVAQRLELVISGPSLTGKPIQSRLDDALSEIDLEYFALKAKGPVDPLNRHESMGQEYLKGELSVPTIPFNRMLRMNDIPNNSNLATMEPARRRELLTTAIDWFIKNKGKKISIALLVAGEASRMQKGSYVPPILTAAQQSDPDRFGRINEDGVDTTPKAKGLLPAGNIGEHFVSFLESHLVNIKRMNDIFDKLGLGRPFVPKFMDNESYHPAMMAEVGRLAALYGFDPKEIIIFQQPLGLRVAATTLKVEDNEKAFVDEAGVAGYELAKKYANEHQGKPIYDLPGTAEGHGEYFHSHLLPMPEYGGKTLLEVSRDKGIVYDVVHNCDNMMPVDSEFLVIFGLMLENKSKVQFEVSRRPAGDAGAGGGFVFDSDLKIAQVEDDIYNASIGKNKFDRGADDAAHGPDKVNPSPVNNASIATELDSAFRANYGKPGELDAVLNIADPKEKADRLAELRQAGRVSFGIVPTFKMVKGPAGHFIGTIIFETRAWDIQKGLSGKVGIVAVPSAEDIRLLMTKEELPATVEEVSTMPGLDDVRFDPLKTKMHFGDAVLQTVREALVRKLITGELVSEADAHLIISRMHQLDPTHLEERIRAKAIDIAKKKANLNIPDSQSDDWAIAVNLVKQEVASEAAKSSSGAIRMNRGALSNDEHRGEKGVNAAVRSFMTADNVKNGNVYALARAAQSAAKPGDIEIALGPKNTSELNKLQLSNLSHVMASIQGMGFSFIVIRGLKARLRVASDLIFHPGIGRRAVYIDEADLLDLLSLPNGDQLVMEAVNHEMAHINNPGLSEAEVEKIASTDKVRMALFQLSLEANLKLAIDGNKEAYDAIVAVPAAELIAYFEKSAGRTLNELPEGLFGFGNGYDVRGNAQPSVDGAVDLTPANLYVVGKLLATHYAQPGDKVLLTGDIRLHTPILRYCMGLGIASTGVNVEYASDLLTTGAHNLLSTENIGNYRFMVQVSGSHGASHKNGFKIKANFGKKDAANGRMTLEPLYAKSLEALYWATKDTEHPENNKRQMDVSTVADIGTIGQVTGTEEYVINTLDAMLPAITQDEIVVIDPRAGAAGFIAAGLLEKRGFTIIDMDMVRENDLVANINSLWQAGNRKIAVMLNKAPDGNMGRGIWDPSKPEALVPSQRLVRLINGSIAEGMPKAIGAVFDGDADRISAVLEDGRTVPAFEMTLPYYQRFLINPDNQEAMLALVKAGSGPIKIVCDVRANSKLLSLIDNINSELKRRAGITAKNVNVIEGYFISTGYPPQLSFVQHRITELQNFVDDTPALKNNPTFIKQFEGMKKTYFTAEASGHNFFHISKSYPERICDCAISGFVALINIRETMGRYEAPALGLAQNKARYELAELFDTFPTAYSSIEVELPIRADIKRATAIKVGEWMEDEYKNQLKLSSLVVSEGEYEMQPKDDGYVTVSGYKIQLKDGRTALVRWSNTSEMLTTIFEGKNQDDLISIVKEITERIRKEGTVDVSPLDNEIARLTEAAKAQKAADSARDLSPVAGMPVTLNVNTGEITLGKGIVSERRWGKTLGDLSQSINPNTAKANPDQEKYYGYRNVRLKGDTKAIDRLNLRFDITVLPPGMIGQEFLMTMGHDHLPISQQYPQANYPEIYEVWNGRALYVQQGVNPRTGKFEFLTTVANPGDRVMLLPGYTHRTINIGSSPLVMANWISDHVGGKKENVPQVDAVIDPGFSGIQAKNGFAYYVNYAMRDGKTSLELEPNPAYGVTPAAIRVLTPSESIAELGLLKGEPMYSQANKEALGQFLIDSNTSPKVLNASLVPSTLDNLLKAVALPLQVLKAKEPSKDKSKEKSKEKAKEKAKAPKNTSIKKPNIPKDSVKSGEDKARQEIYDKYIREDEEALRSTLVSIKVNEHKRKKPVIIVYDTGMDPEAMAAIQTGEAVVSEYLGGTVAVVRGTGKDLYERLKQEVSSMKGKAQKLGFDPSDIAIVTIAGDETLAKVGEELKAEALRDGRAAASLQDALGKIINVAKNDKTKYVPVIALYDIALRWAYGLDLQQIADRLNRVALNPLGNQFTKDDIASGMIRILPRIAPVDFNEANAAYKAAQQALQSL